MNSIKRILVPTDCSAGAAAAGEVAARMASDLHVAIDVVTVVDTSPLQEAYGDVAFRTQRIGEIRSIAFEHAEQFAGRHFANVPEVHVHVRDGNTFLEIRSGGARFPQRPDHHGDARPHRHRPSDHRIGGGEGSAGELGAGHDGARTLVIASDPPSHMKPIQRILVATDCSPCADAAAGVALRLAQPLNAAIDVVAIVDTSGWTDVSGHPDYRRQRVAEIREQARQRARAFADRHLAEVEELRVHVRDSEDTADELVRAAGDLHSDLIVMGTHGATGLTHLILGSVAERVVRSSAIPVVTVRGPT